MADLNIVVIEGTTREQRLSMAAARFVAEVGRQQSGIEIVLVDPMELEFRGDGNDPEGKNARYTAITAKADAFFVVAPEYNHSFPGSLKRLLDSELENYWHKPVAFAGVSNGGWGGVRAIEALVNAVREMGLVASSIDVHFPRVQDMFDLSGSLKPEFVEQRVRVQRAYDELIWLARVLKLGRDKPSSS